MPEAGTRTGLRARRPLIGIAAVSAGLRDPREGRVLAAVVAAFVAALRVAVLALGLVGQRRRRARAVRARGDRRAGRGVAAALDRRRAAAAAWVIAVVLLGSGLMLTRGAVERRAQAGAEVNALIAALAETAEAMPAGSYAFVIVPDRIGAIPFARNAQGGLMLPPVQPPVVVAANSSSSSPTSSRHGRDCWRTTSSAGSSPSRLRT